MAETHDRHDGCSSCGNPQRRVCHRHCLRYVHHPDLYGVQYHQLHTESQRGKDMFDSNAVAGLVFYGSIVATIFLFVSGHRLPAAAVLAVIVPGSADPDVPQGASHKSGGKESRVFPDRRRCSSSRASSSFSRYCSAICPTLFPSCVSALSQSATRR